MTRSPAHLSLSALALVLLPIATTRVAGLELYAAILATDCVVSSGERRASGGSGCGGSGERRLSSAGASARDGQQQKQQVASVCNCGGCSASHRTNHIGAVVGPLLAPWLRSIKVFAAGAEITPSLLGLVPHVLQVSAICFVLPTSAFCLYSNILRSHSLNILQWLPVAKTGKKGGGELELVVRNHALDGLRTILALAQDARGDAAPGAGFAAACAQCADAVSTLLQNSTALETSHVRALLELLLVASHAALPGASPSLLFRSPPLHLSLLPSRALPLFCFQ